MILFRIRQGHLYVLWWGMAYAGQSRIVGIILNVEQEVGDWAWKRFHPFGGRWTKSMCKMIVTSNHPLLNVVTSSSVLTAITIDRGWEAGGSRRNRFVKNILVARWTEKILGWEDCDVFGIVLDVIAVGWFLNIFFCV